MENDIDEYFDLESENVEEKDEIGQKFKSNVYEFGNPGYGYGSNIDAECFDDDDIEIDGSVYKYRGVFNCKVYSYSIVERLEDDNLHDKIQEEFPIPMCNVCTNISNRPCRGCFQRGYNGGDDCPLYSP